MAGQDTGWIPGLIRPLRVTPGSAVDLAKDHDPGARFGLRKKHEGVNLLRRGTQLLAEYQDRLAAQDIYGVLVVLQAMDAAGKDGTIKHVMSGVNPQGVHVSSFKAPSAEELAHDYLWRMPARLPARGQIGIFNRSHYEEVLVVRVHPELASASECRGRQGPGALEAPLPRDQRLGALPGGQRHPGGQVVPQRLQGGTAGRFLSGSTAGKNWKFSAADVGSASTGTTTSGLTRDAPPHQHRMGALVRAARRPQVVHPGVRRRGHRRDADPDRPALPGPGAAGGPCWRAQAELEAEAPPGAARDPAAKQIKQT